MKEFPNKIRFNKHPKRKNNDLVAAMYAMYKRGPDGKPTSLEGIAGVYRKTRQAVYDTFRSRGYKLRQKELKELRILDGYRFTLMKGGYLRGTVGKRRMTMQRYVWEKKRGLVPDTHVLYFKDGNPENVNINNLRLIKKSDMARTFNPTGRNQFSKEVV